MADTLAVKIKYESEGQPQAIEEAEELQAVLQKTSGVTAGGAPANESKTTNDTIQYLRRIQNNPTMRKAFDDYNAAREGYDERGLQNFVQGQKSKYARSYLSLFHSERARTISEARESGMTTEEVSKITNKFDEKYRGTASQSAKDIIQSDPATKDNLSVIGRYLVAGIIAQAVTSTGGYFGAKEMVGAQTTTATTLGFNMQSLPGNAITMSETRMSNEMQWAQLQKQKTEMVGGVGGAAAGLILGGILTVLTGNPMFIPIGGMIVQGIGSGIASYIGGKELSKTELSQTREKAWNKLVSEIYPLAEQRVPVYDQYDTARTKFGARYGRQGTVGSGLGYAPDELYNLMYQSGAMTGKFDRDTFAAQLKFSRAYGYNPNEIMPASISTRYTGEEAGVGGLEMRRGLADKTGMGTRISDLIQAMNQLAVTMTKSGVQSTERGLLETSLLPFMLYGNTAKGRMGDLGMNTLQGMQNMFQQSPGSAGDAFLFNALRGRHKGNIMEFEIMKEKGLYDPEVRGDVFREASKMPGQLGYHLFRGLGIESPNLAKAMMDKALNFNKDGTETDKEGKVYESGVEGWLKKLNDEVEGLSPEETEKRLAELGVLAAKNTSDAEKHAEGIKKQMIETGGIISADIKAAQKKFEEIMAMVLSNQDFWKEFRKMMENTMQTMVDTMKSVVGGKQKDEQNKVIKERDDSEIGGKGGWNEFFYNMTESVNPNKGTKEQRDKERGWVLDKINKGRNAGQIIDITEKERKKYDDDNENWMVLPDLENNENYYAISRYFPMEKYFLSNGEWKELVEKKEEDLNRIREQQEEERKSGSGSGSRGNSTDLTFNININPNELDAGLDEVRKKINAALAIARDARAFAAI